MWMGKTQFTLSNAVTLPKICTSIKNMRKKPQCLHLLMFECMKMRSQNNPIRNHDETMTGTINHGGVSKAAASSRNESGERRCCQLCMVAMVHMSVSGHGVYLLKWSLNIEKPASQVNPRENMPQSTTSRSFNHPFQKKSKFMIPNMVEYKTFHTTK